VRDATSVSVIVPVYNGEAFLAEALESIRGQRVPAAEVIVVDDGSTDQTAQVAQRWGPPPVRYVHQANAGPAAARNRGLSLARGDLVTFLDADDTWPADKLAWQAERLLADPSLDVVLGLTRHLLPDGTPELGAPFVFLNVGCGLYRSVIFDRVGGFDGQLRYSEDIDWFLRAREAGVAIVLGERVALLHRRHDGSMTRGRSAVDLGLLTVLKGSLDRRRAQRRGAALSLPAVRRVTTAEGEGDGPPREGGP
jgi:glycosyltransferase involved in cell wall biosynthesis